MPHQAPLKYIGEYLLQAQKSSTTPSHLPALPFQAQKDDGQSQDLNLPLANIPSIAEDHLGFKDLKGQEAATQLDTTSGIHQQLEKLDPTDANYQQLLFRLLSHKNLKQYIQSLQESDLEIFVELLDCVSETESNIF